MRYLNYYNIATKECNQDDFITWVMKNYKTNDEELKLLAKQFICEFFNNNPILINNYTKIKKMKVVKQRKMQNVIFDITLEFEVDDTYFFLIIEDKINAELNNNLKEYKEIAKKYLEGRNYILEAIVYKSMNFNPNEELKIINSGFRGFDKNKIKPLFLNVTQNFKNMIIRDYFNKIFRPYKNLEFKYWNQKIFCTFLEEYIQSNSDSSINLNISDGTKYKKALYIRDKVTNYELRIQVESFTSLQFQIKVPSNLKNYNIGKKTTFKKTLSKDKCFESDVTNLINELVDEFKNKILNSNRI